MTELKVSKMYETCRKNSELCMYFYKKNLINSFQQTIPQQPQKKQVLVSLFSTILLNDTEYATWNDSSIDVLRKNESFGTVLENFILLKWGKVTINTCSK